MQDRRRGRGGRGRRSGAASWSCRRRSGRAGRRRRRPGWSCVTPSSAVTAPKALLTLGERRPQPWRAPSRCAAERERAAALGLEDRERAGVEGEAGGLADRAPARSAATRALIAPCGGVERDDLGGAEVFGRRDLGRGRRRASSRRMCSGRTPSDERARRRPRAASGTATSAPPTRTLVGAGRDGALEAAGSSSAASR